MKSLKSLICMIPVLWLYGCIDDYFLKPEERLYTPFLYSTRKSGEVDLNWGRPACAFCELCNCPSSEPEYFEILFSDISPTEWKVYATVGPNISQITIKDLTNGKPYYFAVKAYGYFGQITTSRTLMTIPDTPEDVQFIFNTIDKDVQKGTWSPDERFVAYESDFVIEDENYMIRSVFMYNLSTYEEVLIEENSFSPEWSPTESKIVYHSENDRDTVWTPGNTPSHITVYDTQDKIKRRLTSGHSFNFVPTWSPDGEWIAFLSDMAGGNEYNLWKIPADSGQAIQLSSDLNDLTDLVSMTSRSMQKPSWSKDGENIAFSRNSETDWGYVHDIYSISSEGGNSIKTLISSPWNDLSPVYSPDGSSIAFISDRSGTNSIWTMNLSTEELRQITGSHEFWVHENMGKIEWSSSGDKILFTSGYEYFSTLYSVDVE